ncbi:MAG: DNA replication and repair protein RecF [Bacteroidetes bacterium]|nr:MAG: DNA replication and repair protein RecF [Bacteroidota bacterium]
MYLKKLKLINFKNYEEAEMAFSDKINCFVGNNGVGKTNILDAIYYLSFCKSYFNFIDSQNIKHQTDFFSIHGTYKNQNSLNDQVSVIQKRNSKKSFKFNKKEYERLADHIGKIPLVMVSPYDRDLINEGSDVRRKYIDGVISQFDNNYLDNLLQYNKTLAHRNALLRSFAERRNFDAVSLEIWDKKLAEYGQPIFEKRKAFLQDFNPIFENNYRFLSDGSEQIELVYESQLALEPLVQLLSKSVDKDRMLRYTSKGIHKDDLLFKIDGYPVKKFGSQGQQKTFVIAVKLAQFEYMRRVKDFKPVLLFDDIFDKLDHQRVNKIIQLVSDDNFGQVFITDTQSERIEAIFSQVDIDHKIFMVEHGIVTTHQ